MFAMNIGIIYLFDFIVLIEEWGVMKEEMWLCMIKKMPCMNYSNSILKTHQQTFHIKSYLG